MIIRENDNETGGGSKRYGLNGGGGAKIKIFWELKSVETDKNELTFAVHLLSIRVRAKRFRRVHQLVQLRLFLPQLS